MIVTFNTKSTLILLLRNRQMTFPTTVSFQFIFLKADDKGVFWEDIRVEIMTCLLGNVLGWHLKGFSLLRHREICIFHTQALCPFQKPKSLCFGNPEDDIAVEIVFHVPPKGSMCPGGELLSQQVCEAWSVCVSLSKISFGLPSILEFERYRRDTTNGFLLSTYLHLWIHLSVFPYRWSSHSTLHLLPGLNYVLPVFTESMEAPLFGKKTTTGCMVCSTLLWAQIGTMNSLRLACNLLILQPLCISLLGPP